MKEKMNNYEKITLDAIKYCRNEKLTPKAAWEKATEEYRESIQKKGCPKNAFIGLCETGKIKGIEKTKLEPKTKNGKYAIEALKFINKDISIKELWKKVLIETRENLNKSHNNQMNVVKVLFENNEINY